MQVHREVGRTADPQSAIANCPDMLNRDVVDIDTQVREPRQVRSDHATQRAATDNADLQRRNPRKQTSGLGIPISPCKNDTH